MGLGPAPRVGCQGRGFPGKAPPQGVPKPGAMPRGSRRSRPEPSTEKRPRAPGEIRSSLGGRPEPSRDWVGDLGGGGTPPPSSVPASQRRRRRAGEAGSPAQPAAPLLPLSRLKPNQILIAAPPPRAVFTSPPLLAPPALLCCGPALKLRGPALRRASAAAFTGFLGGFKVFFRGFKGLLPPRPVRGRELHLPSSCLETTRKPLRRHAGGKDTVSKFKGGDRKKK